VQAAEIEIELVADERLREREFGIVDLLTHRGIVAQYPEEAARRSRLGKFYYRPPGGESWVDVALRLRSLRDSIVREYPDRRVMLVTHEVPIIITRYLVERLDEPTALSLSAAGSIANCSLTTYVRGDDRRLRLDRDAWTVPLRRERIPITKAPDAPVASR
jgi:broad specificity phosphatase PhoE